MSDKTLPEEPVVSVLDGLPNTLEPLARAQTISARAAAVGFDWKDRAGVRAKLLEELREFDEAAACRDAAAMAEEMGDLLFTVVNLARHAGVDASDALVAASGKFERRFRSLERGVLSDGGRVETEDHSNLERRWWQVKEEES